MNMLSSRKSVADDIQLARDRADQFKSKTRILPSYWSSRNYYHTAQDVVNLCQAQSRSAHESTRIINTLTCQYREEEGLDVARIDAKKVQKMMENYMISLDDLFFFGLLTRRVRTPGSALLSEPLVWLNVRYRKPHKTAGEFRSIRGTRGNRIVLWPGAIENGQMRVRSVGQLFAALVHLMCHAFLAIFADEKDNGYEADVWAHRGHGHQYWPLLEYVCRKVADWLPEASEVRSERAAALWHMQPHSSRTTPLERARPPSEVSGNCFPLETANISLLPPPYEFRIDEVPTPMYEKLSGPMPFSVAELPGDFSWTL